MTFRIRLTDAQHSALTCAGVGHGIDLDELLLARCWCGDQLVFEEADRDQLFRAITEEANAEDSNAESATDRELRRQARGACTALTNLASKVLTEGLS